VRTAVAIIVTVLVAVPAGAAGAYIGLRWARNWRDTIAEASDRLGGECQPPASLRYRASTNE
jgi:hypothetical protein